VQWDAPYNNEQTINKYEILIFSMSAGDWVEDKVFCDGTSINIISNRDCLFPMSVLRDSYGYSFRELVTFKLRANNQYGWADDYGPVNTGGATVRTEPAAVGTIFVNAFQTTTQQVTVFWDELTSGTDRGDSSILSYNLEMDSGSGWETLIGNPTDSMKTQYTVKSHITAGNNYSFRARARNVYGFGLYSATYSFKAAQEPQQLKSSEI
jgi:hypothetical protein